MKPLFTENAVRGRSRHEQKRSSVGRSSGTYELNIPINTPIHGGVNETYPADRALLWQAQFSTPFNRGQSLLTSATTSLGHALRHRIAPRL